MLQRRSCPAANMARGHITSLATKAANRDPSTRSATGLFRARKQLFLGFTIFSLFNQYCHLLNEVALWPVRKNYPHAVVKVYLVDFEQSRSVRAQKRFRLSDFPKQAPNCKYHASCR